MDVERRRRGIGGTDISAIAGLNPYKSAIDVYQEKLHLVKPSPMTPAMRMGLRLEPVLAELYCERAKVELIAPSFIEHPLRPWMVGSPDRLVRDPPGIGVELKTAGLRQVHRWGEDGSDDIPEEYLLQCLWYCALLDYERWDLAVLLGGQEFRIYHVSRDLELEGMLLEIGEGFWVNHVVAQVPPPLDGTSSAKAYVERRYPSHDTEMLRPSAEQDAQATSLRKAREDLQDAERRVMLYENLLKEAIGDHAGIHGDGWWATWKWSRDSRVMDWEGIVKDLAPPQEFLDQYKRHKTGSRRFLFTYEGDKP